MRTVCMLIFCAVLAVPWAAAGDKEKATEKPQQLEGEGGVELTSSYVWRGEVVNDEACFQPCIEFGLGDALLRLWGTWDLRNTSNSSARTRMDATLAYDFVSENKDYILRPALIAYVYNDDYRGRARDTFEIALLYFWRIPYADGRLLVPQASLYYDFSDIEGVYAALGLRHAAELVKDKMDLEIRANVGWGDRKYVEATFSLPKHERDEENRTYTADKSAFLDFTVAISLPMIINERFTLTPGLKYMHLLDSGIRSALDDYGLETDNFGGSLTAGYKF